MVELPMTEPDKPILCIDFDGVLHSYISGWQGDATIIPDQPTEGAEDFLLDAIENFTVYIYSSRAYIDGGSKAIYAYLVKHFGIAAAGACIVTFIKPPAHVTLDDRAILFTGPADWPTMKTLLDFKPWHGSGIWGNGE